jgi:hypothetical protein
MGMWQPRTSVTGMAGMLVMVSPTELQGGARELGPAVSRRRLDQLRQCPADGA